MVKPKVVVHAAARLGGIGDNQINPASYFGHNMRIGINVMKLSAENNCSKLINIGTVCSYPNLVLFLLMNQIFGKVFLNQQTQLMAFQELCLFLDFRKTIWIRYSKCIVSQSLWTWR